MRKSFQTVLALALILGAAGCQRDGSQPVSPADRAAIQKIVRLRVTSAYDFSRPNVVANLMGLYATDTRVVSASVGRVTTSLDSLRQGIEAFWTNVGVNMRNPRVTWPSMYVDVLARDAAVMTATYRIEHVAPDGMPHLIAGAWTAVFQRRRGKWVIIQEHLSDDQTAR